jgi:hypothetical protein
MAKDKKSFILYTDQSGVFNQLPDEIAGKLIKHIFAYVNDENPISDDLIINIAFEPIKQSLKRDLKRYEEYVDKQSVNGAKGGRPKKANETQITQPFFDKPKKADSVSDSDSDSVNDNVNKRKRKVFIKPTIEDIKKEFPTFNAESFLNYYESNGWMVGKNKMVNWSASVKNWIAKDYNQQTQVIVNKPKFGTLEDE